MVITIVGTGLIGGSLSIALQEKGLASHVIGVEQNPSHAAKAIELGLVHECLPLADAIQKSALIIIATPINAAEQILPKILDYVQDQVVFDVGSTKSKIVEAVQHHPKRGRFVATHPMWGTENSGPTAAVKRAFSKKATVICDKMHSDTDALAFVEKLYATLEMHILYMDSTAHDMHVAYISHISHITIFCLGQHCFRERKGRRCHF